MYVKCFMTSIGGKLVIQIPHPKELDTDGDSLAPRMLADLLESVGSHRVYMGDRDHQIFTQDADTVIVFLSEWHWRARAAAELVEQLSN